MSSGNSAQLATANIVVLLQFTTSLYLPRGSLSSSWNRDPFCICRNLPFLSFFFILPLNTSLSRSSSKIFTSYLWCPLKHDPRCLEEISLFFCYEHSYSKLHTHFFPLQSVFRCRLAAFSYLLLPHLKGNLFVCQLLFDFFFCCRMSVRNVVLHLGFM